MDELQKLILRKIDRESTIKAADLFIDGYDYSEVAQALLSLELDNKVECIGFGTAIRENHKPVLTYIYRRKSTRNNKS